MFTAAEMAEHQADAESEMTLTFAVYKPTGTMTTNADGYKVPGFELVGRWRGKVQASRNQGGDTPTRYVRIGDVDRPVLEGGLHQPVSATVPKPSKQRGQGWEYEVEEVGCADDPALLGSRYLIVEVPKKSRASARRMSAVEV